MPIEDKHIADYFIISGLSENLETNVESKQLINSVLPITDVTVIFKNLGEECPIGYTCIETTPGGHSADLNNGNFKSQNILICYRRGNDKPPLIEVGVYHEDRERVLPDIEVVYTTPYGRSASTGTIGSRSGTYITYKRAKSNYPFNQLVVVDLCVILNNKSENPPHAYFPIRKNLNKSYYGMIGSEVFLCYKKTLLSPPSICFLPQIISRFPLEDYKGFPLPETVPLFCLPAGAKIEVWPSNTSPTRPTTSTFILTSDSAQKMYGSSFSFYEPFDRNQLTQEQLSRLGLSGSRDQNSSSEETNSESITKEVDQGQLYSIKSICILSRWPFFDCFEKFLYFLHRLVFNPQYFRLDQSTPQAKNRVPLEHYISHFLLDVSFPTPQRPTVLVQLMPGSDENVIISQPSNSLPLPLTGASFCQLLSIMGVDNTLNLLLFGLSEQKILLHSLHPNLLTGVAEAITAMLFPFHWQCPYVPLCPLSLHGILNAPLPFIVGIDSRCFDTFTPPNDIISIDLNTHAIYLSELKKCLNLKILPKRPARILRNSLDKIHQKLIRFKALGAGQSPQHRSDPSRQNMEKMFELEIQEAFLRFMVTILRGFRQYLLPITSAPTVGATDPTSLFDFEGFLSTRDRSYGQFYHLITKTQMFTHYIEERSFVSDKTSTSLAFFDDCEEKLCTSGDIFSERPGKLFDIEMGSIKTDRSVYIPAPDQSPSVSNSSSFTNDNLTTEGNPSSPTTEPTKCKFGPLNPTLFHRHPQNFNLEQPDLAADNNSSPTRHTNLGDLILDSKNSFSVSRRTKQEIKFSQKFARKSSENPLEWSKYLVSCCFSLWFATLPSYITYCKVNDKNEANQQSTNNNNGNIPSTSKTTTRILRHAYNCLVKMQKLQLNTDEICFRILTLLCGHYGQPALAVRVFFEMKKAGIKPNAVTYGYYNKAVLESKWPDHSINPTTVLWIKIRNVLSGISLFKMHGRMRRDRKRNENILDVDTKTTQQVVPKNGLNEVDRVSGLQQQQSYVDNNHQASGGCFSATTMPLARDTDQMSKSVYLGSTQHRRSLINRSFYTSQKSSLDLHDQVSNVPNSVIMSVKPSMHKSHSMHLHNDNDATNIEQQSRLMTSKSSSFDDEDDEEEETPYVTRTIQPVESTNLYQNANYNNSKKRLDALVQFEALQNKLNLISDGRLTISNLIRENPSLVDSSAGILFSTNPDILMSRNFNNTILYVNAGSTNERQNPIASCGIDDMNFDPILNNSNQNTKVSQNPTTTTSTCKQIGTNWFGEDAQILLKFDQQQPGETSRGNQKSILALSDDTQRKLSITETTINCHDKRSANSASTNYSEDQQQRVASIVTSQPSKSSEASADYDDNHADDESYDDEDEDDDDYESGDGGDIAAQRERMLKNVTSTPNFKLTSLINDASNLQWSKWTGSQNSKSVYKGIKSAATGFVSSLQEIKSSFSISNANTPSKFNQQIGATTTSAMLGVGMVSSSGIIGHSAPKSNTTRDMISQVVNYITSNRTHGDGEGEDSDNSSNFSNDDLYRLSNDEDLDVSAAEGCDFSRFNSFFELLEKFYNNNNNSARDDLLDVFGASIASGAEANNVALEILMTTCSRCTVCHSLLYDEEIMERWSYNESNLNTCCVYCRAKIVPLMTIEINDFRFTDDDLETISSQPLVDLSFDVEGSANYNTTNGQGHSSQTNRTDQLKQQLQDSNRAAEPNQADKGESNDFIVPYLSPIVLRKELENVFESSTDLCASSSRFVDEHPIIFWNLLWYFTRINVPNHLALLCLNSKKISQDKVIPEKWQSSTTVSVKTFWDNEKLHNHVGSPLYRLYKKNSMSPEVDAIFCDNLIFSTTFLNHIIDLISVNDLQKAMNLILNARLKSSTNFSFNKNRHNLYRDLMFLIMTSLDSKTLDKTLGNYERDYRRAFESLNFQQVALNRFDRPPTIGSLCCRKAFRELILKATRDID